MTPETREAKMLADFQRAIEQVIGTSMAHLQGEHVTVRASHLWPIWLAATAAEREACAQECMRQAQIFRTDGASYINGELIANHCAGAIRTRGKQP
jgi:hypothetical protein